MPSKVATKVNGGTVPRVYDNDPDFDNSQLGDLRRGHIRYTREQTYAAPNGDRKEYLAKTEGLTPLERHCIFFDGKLRGILSPKDTFLGFYALGFGLILSLVAAFIIHFGFSYPTKPVTGSLRDWIPDPQFRIWLGNINRAKHGSDAEVIDRRGEVHEGKLNLIFHEYSSSVGRDGLSFTDLRKMMGGQRNVGDFFGMSAFVLEWGATYMLLWPKDGYIKKADILGVYDGSIFVELAHARKQRGAFKAK